MIRRINMFGGPCCGKSTTAAYIYAKLKKRNISVELVREYIKFWCFINRKPKSFDQVYTLGKQLHKEDTILMGGQDLIITDSPVWLSVYYGTKYKFPCVNAIREICTEFEKQYPSLNIYIDRKDKQYQPVGRFGNHNDALEADEGILKVLVDNDISFMKFDYDNERGMTQWILDNIELHNEML